MKNNTYEYIQILERILKFCVFISFIYWGHQAYTQLLSYDESFSNPWYFEMLYMTIVSFGVFIFCFLVHQVIKHIRMKRGLPKFRIRQMKEVKQHPWFFLSFCLIIIFFGLSILVVLVQPLILYHPQHRAYAYQRVMELDVYETYTIEDEENDLVYQGLGHVNKDLELPTIIYFAGNGESSGSTFYKYHQDDVFDRLDDYQFIMIDYPGYGLSEGIPRDDSMRHYSEVVYEYVSQLSYVDQDEIYVYGYSIGTGVATYVASKYQIQGLILVAPYSSILDLFNAYVPIFKGVFSELIVEEFDSSTYAKDVRVAPLIIASKTDETIPIALSEKLSLDFDHLYEFYAVNYTAHNGFSDREDVILKIIEYIEENRE